MTKTPTPASHAVNTAPISVDLRGIDDVGLRSAIGPLINAFGEAQWQSGRGVPHPDLEEAFEAIIAAAQAHALRAAPASPAQQDAAPAFYVRDSDVQALADKRVAGRGAMLHKEAGEGMSAYYPTSALQAAPPAPEAVAVPDAVNVDAWRKGARFALEAVSKVDSICWLTDSMREVCIKQAADAVIAERDRLIAAAPAQAAQPVARIDGPVRRDGALWRAEVTLTRPLAQFSDLYGAPAQEHATQLAGGAQANRYCAANMCLRSDKQHAPGCPDAPTQAQEAAPPLEAPAVPARVVQRVIDTARAVADEAEDFGEDFKVESHFMAPLSLALDDYDAALAAAPQAPAAALDDERAAFEAFMRKDTSGFSLKRDGDSYEEFEVATYWHFWKARAALAAAPAAPAVDAARYRFALTDCPPWTYAVCKWDGEDWLPIKDGEGQAELDAAIDAQAKGGN